MNMDNHPSIDDPWDINKNNKKGGFMAYNLDNYETVKSRKKRWYKDHKDGSLIAELWHFEKGHVVIKGSAYRNKDEQMKNNPTGVGWAEEFEGKGSFANKISWMENCDESAIGRALDNAGYSGNDKCSKEEMEKVERHEKDTPDFLGAMVERNDMIEEIVKIAKNKKLTDKQKDFIDNIDKKSVEEISKALKILQGA